MVFPRRNKIGSENTDDANIHHEMDQDMLKDIIKLSKEYPNDSEFGAKVRILLQTDRWNDSSPINHF